MVGREVEPYRDTRMEPSRRSQTERRGLDHEDLTLGIGDRLDQRGLGVATGDRPNTRGDQHRRDQCRDRRLAVGAGDGHDRTIVPSVGEIEFGFESDPGSVGDGEDGMGLGDPGAGDHEIAPGDEARKVRLGGRFDQFHSPRCCLSANRVGGMLVDDHHRHTAGDERVGDGPAGDSETEDEGRPERAAYRCVHQSITPGNRTKSA